MKKNNFHLIGVGGIGMSALARMLLKLEHKVSGSDTSKGVEIHRLTEEGVNVFKEHSANNISHIETIVVYSTAIAVDNPELVRAKELNCTIWHRSDLLAFLMKSYQALAVTGTHGKTSTSSLLAHVLETANLSPSFAVGGLIVSKNTNSYVGTGSHFVLEADESDSSFLKYYPSGAIVTNVEADHLNHFAGIDAIKDAFALFMSQVQQKELLFWCKDSPHLDALNPKGISYGYSDQADLRITKSSQIKMHCYFDLEFEGKKYEDISLSMIGQHNIANATAVFGLCLRLGIEEKSIREAFKTFKGVKRRAELIGRAQEITIYDDYAHHPTEIDCTLKSFRSAYPKRKIIAFFQPHRFSRFIPFKDDFTFSFQDADEVWVTDVYGAGEQSSYLIDYEQYAQEIEKRSFVKTIYVKPEEWLSAVEKHLKPFDVLITFGAGNITTLGPLALKLIEEKQLKLDLGLIYGSISSEHYVSHVSSRFYKGHYRQDIYDFTSYLINSKGEWVIDGQSLTYPQPPFDKLSQNDILIPCLHGRQGEDGMIQGFLQALNKPYSGANYSVSSLNMNKIWMKAVVKDLGIKVVKGIYFSPTEWKEWAIVKLAEIENEFAYPMVVKPANMGSTIGVSFVNNQEELIQAIDGVIELEDTIIIEEMMVARELEIATMDTEDGLVITQPGEVKSDVRRYDYVAKYSATPIEKVVQANLSSEQILTVRKLVEKIYRGMQINSYARIDFFLTEEGEFVFGEVNTLPGTTPRSLFPRMLMSYGLEGSAIIDQMVIDGLYRHRHESRKSLKINLFLNTIKEVTHQQTTAV